MWALCRHQMELNYRRLDPGDKNPQFPWNAGTWVTELVWALQPIKLPSQPVLLPLVFGRPDLTSSQSGRRVGVLSSGMWRIAVTDVSSLSPERQIAHRTQSSLALPWESKISYSHYTYRATHLSIFNIIKFLSEWLRLQHFRLEGLAFKD
jgi:hypothetical protein